MLQGLDGTMMPCLDGDDEDLGLGFTEPASFATIDPAGSTPRSFNVTPITYTPYNNKPVSRIIPKKRYVILPPANGQRSHFPGISHLRQIREPNSHPAYQRRMVQSSVASSSSWLGASVRNPVLPHHNIITRPARNTQYVLKIPVVRERDMDNEDIKPEVIPRKTMAVQPHQAHAHLQQSIPHLHHQQVREPVRSRLIETSLPMHIPTVPASMSMGGEYTEEEELEEHEQFHDLPENVSGGMTSYYTSSIRAKQEQVSFSCLELDCFWRGSSLATLQRHMQITHVKKHVNMMSGNKKLATSTKPIGKPKGVRCSECDTMAYSRPLLLKHMNSVHGLEAPLINKTFESREELQQWLDELRTTHAVEFVVSSGSKKWGYGLQVHYLTCSRSGDQKERPNKKYARPPRPSIKCGKNCMAYLKIKQNPVTSTLQIEGCLHHSGHFIDGNLIRLTPIEQRKIAAVAEQQEQNQLHWDESNMGAVRDVLGHFGRFRLIQDQLLCSLLKEWIEEYKLYDIKPSVSYYSSSMTQSTSNDVVNFDNLLTADMMLDSFVDDYDEDSPASPIQAQL